MDTSHRRQGLLNFCLKPCPYEEVLRSVRLTPLQASIVRMRYIPLVHHLRTRTQLITFLFHSSRTIITVGSLIVPALLSIQYSATTPETTTDIQLYWAVWVISLCVTIANGLLTLFKLDKKYYFLHTILEQLISEGWQYIELSGRFSGFYTPGQRPTHDNQFVFFCHTVEKIRMRQIQEEYYKLTDLHQTSQPPLPEDKSTELPAPPNAAAIHAKLDGFLPPTPLKEELLRLAASIGQLPTTAYKESSTLAENVRGGRTTGKEKN
jgi:hypothetical protein